ncbi:hypothetical protein pb186bvf_014969 [Paramecium bursaria]
MKYMIILCLIAAISAQTYTRVATQCPYGTSTTATAYAYWNSQQCVQCQTYCTCTSYLGCDVLTCPSTYTKYNNACYSCPTGCKTCSLGNTNQDYSCSECSTGYQLLAGICVQLASIPIKTSTLTESYTTYTNPYTQQVNPTPYAACSQYDPSNSLCQTCPQGTFLNEFNACESCISGCSSCNARGTCTTCSNGFYYSYTQNEASAVSSATSTSSTTGFTGYYYYGAGACVACTGQFVLTCNSSTALTCLAGYYLSSGQCTSCGTNCTACTGSNACTTCAAGYYVSSGSCVFCYGNIGTTISCSACTASSGNSCDTCATGYTKINSTCINCSISINGCAICASSGATSTLTCTTCQNGYYPSSNNGITTCIVCGMNIALCDFSNNVVVPTQCNSGYILVPIAATGGANTCVANANNCLTGVDSSQACKTCYPSSYLVNTKCVACTTLTGCTACSVSGSSPSQILQCTSCVKGLTVGTNYVLNSQSGTCTACPTGCLTCNADSTCNDCQYGYGKNGTTCQLCTTNNCQVCTIATSGQTCTTCLSGYFLYTTSGTTALQQCNVCPVGCSTCSTTGQTCTTCITGFYLRNGACNYGVQYCSIQNIDGTCSKCMYGYRIVQNVCKPCIDFYGGFVCGTGDYAYGFLLALSALLLFI